MKSFVGLILLFFSVGCFAETKLPDCPKLQLLPYNNCFGKATYEGDKYIGEFKNDKRHGQGEIFQLDDGSIWEIRNEYEYMYEYYPSITACPSKGVVIVDGKKLNAVRMK